MNCNEAIFNVNPKVENSIIVQLSQTRHFAWFSKFWINSWQNKPYVKNRPNCSSTNSLQQPGASVRCLTSLPVGKRENGWKIESIIPKRKLKDQMRAPERHFAEFEKVRKKESELSSDKLLFNNLQAWRLNRFEQSPSLSIQPFWGLTFICKNSKTFFISIV